MSRGAKPTLACASEEDAEITLSKLGHRQWVRSDVDGHLPPSNISPTRARMGGAALMDVQILAARTRLSNRRIRYVLDHRLLPGVRVKTDDERHGHPRSFTDLEGFGIAAAATLLEGGLRRDVVTSFLESLCLYVWERPVKKSRVNRPSRTFLEAAFDPTRDKASSASLGDGLNVRFRIGNRDTNWLQPKTFAKLKDFQPAVTVCLDLRTLRKAVRG